MIEVETSKDIKQHDPRVIGPLTFRQLVCVFVAAFPAVLIIRFLPFSLLTRMIIAIVLTSPIIACGWCRIYGLPLEKYLLIVLKNKTTKSKKRIFASEYDYFNEEDTAEATVTREEFFK